jgi:hypothetical protein
MQRVLYFFIPSLCVCLIILGQVSVQSAPKGNKLLGMTDWPTAPASAIALDENGGIYRGSFSQWTQIGTTPSAPANIWTRNSTHEVFIVLVNGDVYRLESDYSLTYDSNVFAP